MSRFLPKLLRGSLRSAVRFMARSGAQRRAALEALATLYLVRVGLSFLPLAQVQRRLERPLRPRSGVDLSTLTWSVERLSRLVPGATCLVKALAARRLLARHGFKSELHIGVAKEGAELRAHAWLCCGGRVISGNVANLADYRPLERRSHVKDPIVSDRRLEQTLER